MTWNPRPFVPWSDVETSDYYAGYSDGYHGDNFGAGHDGSRDRNSYLAGYNDGTSDRKAALHRVAAETRRFAQENPIQIVVNGKIHP